MEDMENMEPMENTEPERPVRQPNPRRRKRDPRKEFIQTYLPAILVVLVVILLIVFIVSAVNRSKDRKEAERQSSIAAQQSSIQQLLALASEANALVAEADALAAGCNYDEAIAVLDRFSGEYFDFDVLIAAKERYENAKNNLVAWEDPSKIVNLSCNLLIADPVRAFANDKYGSSFKRNFITVSEFTDILTQLHANGYMLVNLDDIVELKTGDDGKTTYAAKTLYLPAGKTPLLLTQTHVNYNTYMIDGDGDGLADKGGSGFASRLVLDANGQLTCEYVDANGNQLTGAYDLVPILNTFLKSHPDFSYQGAKAILAVSGYDGLFGYRTDPETAEKIGEEFYQQQLAEVPAILDALRADGYTLACYTYDNLAYRDIDLEKLDEDLANWEKEVTPILGETDILVFAKESDIGRYEGDKYDSLMDAGFRYYLGFSRTNEPWLTLTEDYVRQGRLLINGGNLTANPTYFTGLFDAASVLDPSR